MSSEGIRRVVIRDADDGQGGRRYLAAEFGPAGELVLDGCDSGPVVERTFGDFDYEYQRQVPGDRVPEVLLRLVAERFDSDSSFHAWLERHGIPSSFSSWI